MRVRAATASDAPAISDVITNAFADDGRVAALWTAIVTGRLDRTSVVALEEGRVVGHVGVSHAWLDSRRELVDVALLSPLSVQVDRQGEGIGTALVAAAIRAADEMGAPALFLEGDPGFYGDRGFERARNRGFESPSRRIPEPAFQVATLSRHATWMTGRVVYRDVWWIHDSAGLRDPDLREVERRLRVASRH